MFPPRNITDQALAHCSHSLLQPPEGVRPYCISDAAEHPLRPARDHWLVSFFLTNYLISQSSICSDIIFFNKRICRYYIDCLPLPLSLVRHVSSHVRLHVSSKLLAFSRARIKLIFLIIFLQFELKKNWTLTLLVF